MNKEEAAMIGLLYWEGEVMDRMVIAGGYGICLFSADTLQDFLKREKIRKRKLLSLLQKDKELYLNTQREGIFIPLVGIDHYNYAIKLEGQDEPFDDQWVQKISYEGFNLEVKDGLWISAIEQLEPFEPKEYHIKEEEFYTTLFFRRISEWLSLLLLLTSSARPPAAA